MTIVHRIKAPVDPNADFLYHIGKEKIGGSNVSRMKTRLDSAKREQRAIQLFEYIEKCEIMEKEKRRKQLSELVTAQRQKLEEKTAELVKNRMKQIEFLQQEKRRKYKEVSRFDGRNVHISYRWR
jgi:hypothetical protein